MVAALSSNVLYFFYRNFDQSLVAAPSWPRNIQPENLGTRSQIAYLIVSLPLEAPPDGPGD